MTTATQRPVCLRVGDFQVESLGVEWPDYFQGYGLGPRSTFNYCAYGIGDTEEEALADCLDMAAQQGFDVDGETEERIRAEYGPADDSETALEALGVEEETRRNPLLSRRHQVELPGRRALERGSEACQPGIASLSGLLPARPLFPLLGASGVGLHAPY